MFQKKRKLVITTEQIVQCNSNKNGEVLEQNSFNDLQGVTKSLLQNQHNFILHFRHEAGFEMTADNRDEILDLIQQVYWLKFNKKSASAPKLKLFGVSVKQLAKFVTSDKNIQSKINRIPNDYYLVNDDESAKKKAPND